MILGAMVICELFCNKAIKSSNGVTFQKKMYLAKKLRIKQPHENHTLYFLNYWKWKFIIN
jgi:hypothetical protein